MSRDSQRFPGPIGYLSSEGFYHHHFSCLYFSGEDDISSMLIFLVGNYGEINAEGGDVTETSDTSWERRKLPEEDWKQTLDVLFGPDNKQLIQSTLCSIQSIIEGNHDLRVPHLAAVIDQIKYQEHLSSYTITLIDQSGSISAFLSSKDMQKVQEMHSLRPSRSTAVYLQGVSIYVTKTPFERHLCLHWKTFRRLVSMTEEKAQTMEREDSY